MIDEIAAIFFVLGITIIYKFNFFINLTKNGRIRKIGEETAKKDNEETKMSSSSGHESFITPFFL